MVRYSTTILKFRDKGEKSGWTYIEIPADVAQKLKPKNKRSFRVKGLLDAFAIKATALLPMGDGAFILPLNATLRRGIKKKEGAMLKVQLEEDKSPQLLDADLMECLNDEPKALAFFNKLNNSHRNYFSKWICTAKTEDTKARRIAEAVNALSKGMGFPEMLRARKLLKR